MHEHNEKPETGNRKQETGNGSDLAAKSDRLLVDTTVS
jgi:hypothetical protein